jgi:hypothetical protein
VPDASGTPTTNFSIPKYNTGTDAPSGKGFNTAMDFIDTLLANNATLLGARARVGVRKNSTGSDFIRRRLNLIEGAGVVLTVADDAANEEVDITIASSAGSPGYGTAFPGSPTDGQEYILVDSTTNPTYQWYFRYNAGSSSTYKWEFVGGAPARNATTGLVSTTSTTRAALGPGITVPRAGDYLVEVAAAVSGSGAANALVYLGASIAGNITPYIEVVTANMEVGLSYLDRLNAVSASTNLQVAGYVSAGTGNYSERSIAVTPIRVI